MIVREGGQLVVCCDSCPETLETDTNDFGEARSAMRLAHWTSKLVRGLWVHTCADCERPLGFQDLGEE